MAHFSNRQKGPGSLNLVLYPVIFESRPQKEASRIAEELYASSEPEGRSMFGTLSRDQLRQIISEIRLELKRPTQNVRNILDLRGSEEDLREYLTLVADHLDRKLVELGGAKEPSIQGHSPGMNRENRPGWSLPLSWIFVVLVILAAVIWVLFVRK